MRTNYKLKEYIDYVFTTNKMTKIIDNEEQIRYCQYISKVIKKFCKKHILCYLYIMGKINTEKVGNLMGIAVRSVNRVMTKQKEQLIQLIEQEEKIFEKKEIEQ